MVGVFNDNHIDNHYHGSGMVLFCRSDFQPFKIEKFSEVQKWNSPFMSFAYKDPIYENRAILTIFDHPKLISGQNLFAPLMSYW